MREFSIKDLENLTGIKAHTIRMWEQRYNLLQPERTETNIRYYTGKDLKLLLNVSLLIKMGYRISRIAQMEESEMKRIITESTDLESTEGHFLNILKIAMVNYDELLFNNVMERFLSENDVEQAFKSLFIPFLNEIGVLWQTDAICPAQEHFISHLIRQKVYAYIDALPVQAIDKQPVFVLYLPENELHDLGLLMMHYVLRFAGKRSVFLGQSVPIEDLLQLTERMGSVIFISYIISSPLNKGLGKYFTQIVEAFSDSGCEFHFTGAGIKDVENPYNGLINIHERAESIIQDLL